MCCSDAEANAGDYGDADTGGAADIVRWSAAGFVEDGGGGPECAFIWFLHEGVGDAIFAIGCGGEDGDEFGQCLEIFLPDCVEAVVFVSCGLGGALCLEVCYPSHGGKDSDWE